MIKSSETILSQLGSSSKILEIVKSNNGTLTIEENDEYRWIKDNFNAYYTILDKIVPERIVLPYLQSMMSALLFISEPKSTLVLGAGGGALLRFLFESFPNFKITAIDNDAVMIDITYKYFNDSNVSDISIKNTDAMSQITGSPKNSFDLIFVDLFTNGAIPELFYQISFYEECRRCGFSGITVFNLIIDNEGSFKRIMKLLLLVFNNQCLCLSVVNYKNIIVLGFGEKNDFESDIKLLRLKAESLQILHNINYNSLVDEIITSNVLVNNKIQF